MLGLWPGTHKVLYRLDMGDWIFTTVRPNMSVSLNRNPPKIRTVNDEST